MSIKLPLRAQTIGSIFALFALIILACSINGNESTEQIFSFTKSYDELAQFDSVQIDLKDTSGHTLDNLYRGKVDTVREIEQLKASHWQGGVAVLSFIGYKDGEVVYKVEKRFNGANDQVLDTLRIILPDTKLSVDGLELQMTEGDTVSFPKIAVTPVELSDKSLFFTSSAPLLLQVEPTHLRALKRGTAKLIATLKSKPSITLIFNVTILRNPLTPDSLFLTPDTMYLAAGGSVGSLAIRVSPASADGAVTWSIKDSSTARFTSQGMIEGVRQGETVAFATSKRIPGLMDSSLILVSAHIAVKEVEFQNDSLDLFVGGAAESLSVVILPALANPKVTFEVLNPALVTLIGSRIQGLAEGTTGVIARSIENPAVVDTLNVVIFPTQKVDSVRLSADTLKLFTGAPGTILTSKVYPLTSNPSLHWRSQNPLVAAVDGVGKISPVSPGKTLIIALSRVDSTRQDTAIVVVNRDMPQVSVGRDTVVSLGATLAFRPYVTQEFGSVVLFRWDLNGDGTWDGTSDSIETVSYTYEEAKEITAAFSIKDTEGNDTTVTKKIKAVTGPAVQILSPKDSTYTRMFTIDVTWSVNSKEQDSLKKQALKLGVNTLTRSAKDEAGNIYSASITVIVDTTPPNKPLVHGSATTSSKTPTWTWVSGGRGGAGTYKYWLDVDDSSKSKQINDTTYTPSMELTEGEHTLFVAETDLAGNWSVPGKLIVKIDVTAPGAPVVATVQSSPTNVQKPKWIWATIGNDGIGVYQYKLDNGNLATGATSTTDTTYTPTIGLAQGLHTLYVREKDSAGNWSALGSAGIVLDTIAPGAPVVILAGASPTNNSKPTWNWTSGGGGKGFYRYKIGDTIWASGGVQGTEKTYTSPSALAEGVKTLFVEEQDSAGNWSISSSASVAIDVTSPTAPMLDSTPYSPLNTLRPTWTWKSGGGGYGTYRCKLDDNDLNSGTISVTQPSFSAVGDLTEGKHTLYVQERDAVGNWSVSSSRQLVLSLRGNVGLAGFSPGGVSSLALALNGVGVPYVLFRDGANGNKATVMRFNGTAWENVGNTGFSTGAVNYVALAIDGNTGYPFVLLTNNSGKASVMWFNGVSWQDVGLAGFPWSFAGNPSLAVSPTGVPYIAFSDSTQGYKATVMRYNGTYWQTVGPDGFTDGEAGYPKLTFSSSGSLYIAFSDVANGEKASVMRFGGASWEKVGNVGFSAGAAYNPSLALNSTGVPYVAFSDDANGGKVTVMRLTGTSWGSVGKVGFSEAATLPSLAIDDNGLPYATYADNANGNKAVMQRFNGTGWESVGPTWLSFGGASDCSLALNKMGIPYLAFIDGANGSKATVVKASFDP